MTNPRRRVVRQPRSTAGLRSLCVIGCTPYVDFTVDNTGYAKFRALVNDMVNDCAAIVHVGDTKPPEMPCNVSLMTKPIHFLRKRARATGRLVLYAPGDNEINDCHRMASRNKPADIYSAVEARQFVIGSLALINGRDITGRYGVQQHIMNGTVPGSPDMRYKCEFDKYAAFDHFAVATLEVPGAHWYLEDETADNPRQNDVDPLSERIWMYLNARDCALDWLDVSAARAAAAGKRVLFVLFHGMFYTSDGSAALRNSGIGPYYDTENLERLTERYTGNKYSQPYQPLFAKLTRLGLQYPRMQFVVVHSDGHKISMNRLNPTLVNTGLDPNGRLYSNHNVMVHMVEGDSKGLTMYSKFTVDPSQFYPVTHQQRWSRAAYNTPPLGHSRIAY